MSRPGRAVTAAGLGAVVLAGGRSARFGEGVDKTGALLNGEPLLGHVLRAVPDGVPVVVVGPRPDDAGRLPGGDRVRWVLERQRFGGPVTALAAGERALPDDVTLVLVLAGDQPFATDAVPALLAHDQLDDPVHPEDLNLQLIMEARIAVDAEGVRQPLLAVYSRAALRRALEDVGAPDDARSARGPSARGPSARGPSMRALLARLRVREVAVPPRSTIDVDTPADLDAARRHRRGPG